MEDGQYISRIHFHKCVEIADSEALEENEKPKFTKNHIRDTDMKALARNKKLTVGGRAKSAKSEQEAFESKTKLPNHEPLEKPINV